MSSGLRPDNPIIVSAFKTTLLHQAVVAVFILVAVALARQAVRLIEARRLAWSTAGGTAPGEGTGAAAQTLAEAPARRLLRVGVAGLWILDGLLQAQPQMPLGLTDQVIKPVAGTSPVWVQHVVNAGASIWSYHPIEAAAAAVWIEVGLGLWLLVAPRGAWSRLAGAASVSWALLVWVFGEAFGGLFSPGQSLLFGTPGSVLLYAVAGVLVALPERRWADRRLGRAILFVFGLFFLAMAVLQAWPGRGFWQGRRPGGGVGTLAQMVETMARTPQPRLFSSWVSAFGSFDVAHGFAVNAFVVGVLVAVGLLLLFGRTRALLVAVVATSVLGLATWVLVEDFGFFGGTGTDPNTMVPLVLLLAVGYVACTRVPAKAPAVASLAKARGRRVGLAAWWAGVVRQPSVLLGPFVAAGAAGIVVLGAAPMAVAAAQPEADPIIAQALGSAPQRTDFAARPFSLVDQHGTVVSLASLRGRTVALTFLDPVCVNDCPIIAQEFAQADALAGGARRHLAFVAVVANPLYRGPAYVDAFDRQEGLTAVGNWYFLTGSLAALRSAWSNYGIQVSYETGGAMVGHTELAFVIGPKGRVRAVLNTDPGPATGASTSSFADTLASTMGQVAGGG